MKQIMLTAMHSGAGKTVMTCALLAALKKRGLDVQAFKCGPDYIDPMFHSQVLGLASHNLDMFLQGWQGVKNTLCRQDCDIAVLEGAMGYYDGLAGTEKASAWEIAKATNTPAVLVLRPKGSGLSLAAQIKGMLDFRPESGIQGLLLSDCKRGLAEYLSPMLERETDLPVLGYLPPMREAEWESRHLGLMTAAEVENLAGRINALALQLEKTVDVDKLLALAAENNEIAVRRQTAAACCRIAVSRDEAFCFTYTENLEALRSAGAELIFFSPLHDAALPEGIDGLYLCGGYPELHAAGLAENYSMRQSICAAVTGGLPTIAECGGFLYLQQSLEDENGEAFPMCGALPGRAYKTEHLQRFGYQWISAEEDSLLFRRGERIPAHEFHYWDCTENGTDLLSEKSGGKNWRCGFATETLYAAFPHLHLDGVLPLAERFIEACVRK